MNRIHGIAGRAWKRGGRMHRALLFRAVFIVTVVGSAIYIGEMMASVEKSLGRIDAALQGDPESPVNKALITRSEEMHGALYGVDGTTDGVVHTLSEVDRNVKLLLNTPNEEAKTRKNRQ